MWSWETHCFSWLPGQLCPQRGFQESHVQELIKKKHRVTYVRGMFITASLSRQTSGRSLGAQPGEQPLSQNPPLAGVVPEGLRSQAAGDVLMVLENGSELILSKQRK